MPVGSQRTRLSPPLLPVERGPSQLTVEQNQSDYCKHNQNAGQQPSLIAGKHHLAPADDLVPPMNEITHFGLLWRGRRRRGHKRSSWRNADQMRTRPEWLLTLGPIKQLRRLFNQNPVSLIDPNFGEQKAHTCAIACSRQLSKRLSGAAYLDAGLLIILYSYHKVKGQLAPPVSEQWPSATLGILLCIQNPR